MEQEQGEGRGGAGRRGGSSSSLMILVSLARQHGLPELALTEGAWEGSKAERGCSEQPIYLSLLISCSPHPLPPCLSHVWVVFVSLAPAMHPCLFHFFVLVPE